MPVANPYARKEEIYGFQTFYREVGYYISKIEQYERALKYFDEAVSKTPNDRRALLGRSWARSKACQYKGALEDIRKILDIDRDDLIALAHKALNTYLSCEFEDGLVQNTRLLPIRKKPEYFKMGFMHCSDAVENCVGDRAGRPLRDHFKIIRNLAWNRTLNSQKPFEPKAKYKKSKKKPKVARVTPPKVKTTRSIKTINSLLYGYENVDDVEKEEERSSIKDSLHSNVSAANLIPAYDKPFPFKPLQEYTSNIENYMAEKYLNTLYMDKIFLKRIRNCDGITSPNEKGNAKIQAWVKNGYKTVSYIQELLRTRRPFYFIKYQEATSTGGLKMRQARELEKAQQTAKKDADFMVSKMESELEAKNLRGVLDMADKLQAFCKSKPKKILVNREKYLDSTYECICQGYYDLKRINKDQYMWDQEKRIYFMFGLHLSREPSEDSVIEQLKGGFVDNQKQIALYNDKLKEATKPAEIVWIYHELARLYIDNRQFEFARAYVRKCITQSRILDNMEWVINALYLSAKCNAMQHNKNDTKSELERALVVANEIEDETVVEFTKKCLEVIEKIDFGELFSAKQLQQREQKILGLMSDKMKEEASHLFRMMSAMPAQRRMSVMPGIRIEDTIDASKPQVISKRMSIMPAGNKVAAETVQLAAPTVVQAKGKVKEKEKKDEGIGFMDLIQYHID